MDKFTRQFASSQAEHDRWQAEKEAAFDAMIARLTEALCAEPDEDWRERLHREREDVYADDLDADDEDVA